MVTYPIIIINQIIINREEVTMKIALNFEIKYKEEILTIKSKSGKTLVFPKDHVVQKKIHMVTLAELSNITIEKICELFNYRTRKSFYDVRRAVLQNDIDSLIPKKTGPKCPPKRTPELEKRIIQLRLNSDYNMYGITDALNKEGFNVKPRLVGQIINDYGISKKKSLPPK